MIVAKLGHHAPVRIALSVSAVTLLVGSYLSWCVSATWMNRAGAILIIVGVLLGATRFYDWIDRRIRELTDERYLEIAESAMSETEATTGAIAPEKRNEIMKEVRRQFDRQMSDVLREGRVRQKSWELYLVVSGTFLNGFGDWLIGVLKNGA